MKSNYLKDFGKQSFKRLSTFIYILQPHFGTLNNQHVYYRNSSLLALSFCQILPSESLKVEFNWGSFRRTFSHRNTWITESDKLIRQSVLEATYFFHTALSHFWNSYVRIMMFIFIHCFLYTSYSNMLEKFEDTYFKILWNPAQISET